MPPNVLITDLSPAELLHRAVTNARRASTEIDKLSSTPLREGQTLQERLTRIADHALALAEAFTIVDALMTSELTEAELHTQCDCATCKPARAADLGAN